jgi:hypothetical protein
LPSGRHGPSRRGQTTKDAEVDEGGIEETEMLKRTKSLIARGWTVAVLVLLGSAPLRAQEVPPAGWTLSPNARLLADEGLPVIPLFEGWYQNPDGTYTFEFGFWNRNHEQAFVIPIGDDNSIVPAEYSGGQPTIFQPSNARGYSHGDNTGSFTVTVPAEFAEAGGQVVWTLRSNGSVASVPGEAVSNYGLSLGPQAGGSLPPMLKLEENGPELWGPYTADGDPRERSTTRGLGGGTVHGSYANPVVRTASVGAPLTLTVWVGDRFVAVNDRERLTPGVTWFTHQGPAPAELGAVEVSPDGSATATATFTEPGRYLLLARADNFRGSGDSSTGDHCCWTNGYVEVNVSE